MHRRNSLERTPSMDSAAPRKPRLGDMVWFGEVSDMTPGRQAVPLVAIVVHVYESAGDRRVNLAVFHRDGMITPRATVAFSPELAAGCWSWPAQPSEAED